MESYITLVETLLLIAALVAILAKKLHIPYTVGLVIAGIMLTTLSFGNPLILTKELIYKVLLPPLIFETTISLPWNTLRKEFMIVTTIATFGIIISAGVVAAGMYLFLGWPFLIAGIFGALIAATDPVSVIAAFKESKITGRLRLLMEAESLFNDGTAAVMFGVLMSIYYGNAASFSGIAINMIQMICGGIACGAIISITTLYLARKTTDHLIEITFTTIAAYGSFILAEHLHCSGVLATLTAGLIIGNSSAIGIISAKGKQTIESFWEYIAFVANSLIFLLIGVHEAKQNFSHLWLTVTVAVLLVILGRALAVFPIAILFTRSKAKISMARQFIMFWGGMRGALSLALALGLPKELPYRELIVTTTFAVVAFSVIIQGLTMTPLLRYFGEITVKQPANIITR